MTASFLLLAGTVNFASAMSVQDDVELWVSKAHPLYLVGDIASAQAVLDRAIALDADNSAVVFEQALLHDANGQHEDARRLYDTLAETERSAASAIPSAINLVVLGRQDEARQQFERIARDSAETDARHRAQLWLLHLASREGSREELLQLTTGVAPLLPYQQAIVDLYRGEGSVAAIDKALTATPFSDESARRSARVESAFFAASYLQYVAGDAAAARTLYRRALPGPESSIQRPPIQRALASLQSSFR